MERQYLQLKDRDFAPLRMRPEAVGHGVLGAGVVTVEDVANRRFDTRMLSAPQPELRSLRLELPSNRRS